MVTQKFSKKEKKKKITCYQSTARVTRRRRWHPTISRGSGECVCVFWGGDSGRGKGQGFRAERLCQGEQCRLSDNLLIYGLRISAAGHEISFSSPLSLPAPEEVCSTESGIWIPRASVLLPDFLTKVLLFPHI